MASSDTTRALFWLVLAAAFLGGVTWWKYDDLIGKKPQPTPPVPSFKRIRGEADGPKTEITVRTPDDKPAEGARVCLLSRQGAVIADDITGADGKVVLISTQPSFYSVAAWHPDHEIVAIHHSEGPAEIKLKPLTYLSVTLGPDSEAQRRWRKTDEGTFQLKVNRTFNPLAGKPEFMRFKMYDHLGMRDKEWRAEGTTTKIPRPCPSPSMLSYSARQTLDDNLDRSGRMNRTPPPGRSGKTIKAKAVEVNAETEIALQVDPQGEHSLTAHYTRREGETGVIMLHLSALERKLGAPNYGELTNVLSDYSTYEDVDGRITFQVFDLPATPMRPTLIHFGADGTRQFIRCNPVAIQGATEAKLERLQLCNLTIEVEGDPEPTGLKRTVLLLDDHLEPVVHHDSTSAGRTYTWNNLYPLTYYVSGRSGDYAIPQQVLQLKPGENQTVKLTMKRAGAVNLLAKRGAVPAGMSIKNEEGVEYLIVPGTMIRHCAVKISNNDALMSGLRNELFLPYGSYEITPMDRWARKSKTIKFTVDAPVKTIRLE